MANQLNVYNNELEIAESFSKPIQQPADFTLPLVKAVKQGFKNPLGIISAAILLLSALAFTLFDFANGSVLSLAAVSVLGFEIIAFVNSHKANNKVCLKSLWITLIVSAGLFLAYIITQTLSFKLPLDFSISQFLTVRLRNIFEQEYPLDRTFALLAALGLIISAAAILFISRSVKKNVPKAKFSFAAIIIISLIVVAAILIAAYLFLVRVEIMPFRITRLPITAESVITAVPVGLGIISGALSATRFIIIYLNVKKVKNAFLK